MTEDHRLAIALMGRLCEHALGLAHRNEAQGLHGPAMYWRGLASDYSDAAFAMAVQS